MTNTWKIVWTDAESVHELCFPNGESVLECVNQLHADPRAGRPMVEIMRLRDGGPSLSIGVGSEETVLTFEGSSEPPYYVSLGNPGREGISPMFIHGGQGIEHLARNLIPWDHALKGLQEFVTTGDRPEAIDWERL